MTFRSVSTYSYTNTGSTIPVPVPAGATVNDIALAHLFVKHTGTTITGVPTGFTLDTTLQHVGAAHFWAHYAYWKRLTTADSGTYTFTLSGVEGVAAICVLFSGRVTSGSPMDVTSVTATAPVGTDTAVNAPSTTITPVTAGSDLVWGAFPYASAAAGDKPSAFTQAALDVGGAIEAYLENQPASSSGALVQGTLRADEWTVLLHALTPASAAAVMPDLTMRNLGY